MKDIKLINSDCFEEMKNIQDKSIDLILCDLPYGILNRAKRKNDTPLPFDELWKNYKRIIKDNGAIILFGSGMFTANLIKSNPKMWRYNLIWKKGTNTTGFLNARRMPLRNHEDIVVFYKKLPIYNPQFIEGKPYIRKNKVNATNNCYGTFEKCKISVYDGKKFPKTIIDVSKDSPPVHPTQKPVTLLKWLIKTYTNPNEIVLDNCMGSGSTGVACIKTKRRFIGIELDENYFRIAKTRCGADI